jgi:hypothetical protein
MEMNKLFQNKRFKFGFRFGMIFSFLIQIISFIIYAIDLYTFENPQGVNIDMIWSFGFPIPIFYGGFLSPNGFIWWRGIIANLLFAVIFSFVVGMLFKFVWEKFTAKKLR